MFLHDLFEGMLRRWYIVLVGIALTLCGGFLLYRNVPLTYQATASIVLVPPATAVVDGENPYLYMGGLDQALSVLTVKLNSNAVSDGVVGKYTGAKYYVQKDPLAAGPILLVTVTAASNNDALEILKDVQVVVPQNLASLQDQLKVPKSSRISTMDIVSDSKSDPQTKNRIRLVIAAVGAGGAVTVLATAIIDSKLSRRRRRKSRSLAAPEGVAARSVPDSGPVNRRAAGTHELVGKFSKDVTRLPSDGGLKIHSPLQTSNIASRVDTEAKALADKV
ncbi:hypothetical protein [Arthrobacter dokdonensis]|uniref:hypothetical protein n=1 Tax=Arthrobacter dokdonellae TaxID=2211210 RepID=UPI000DE5B37D|nr:hypothetical protein [Arthrobacter dokdonellae]